MLADLSIKDFLKKVASDTPLPAGGSVIALIAALASALAEMSASISRKDCENIESEMTSIASDARRYREKLIGYIDKDADAYNEIITAYKMPKSSEEEKEVRKKAVQQGFEIASLIPLEVAEYALKIMQLSETAAKKGKSGTAPDASAGFTIAQAAVSLSLNNVRVNLKSVTDKAFVNDCNDRMKKICQSED